MPTSKIPGRVRHSAVLEKAIATALRFADDDIRQVIASPGFDAVAKLRPAAFIRRLAPYFNPTNPKPRDGTFRQLVVDSVCRRIFAARESERQRMVAEIGGLSPDQMADQRRQVVKRTQAYNRRFWKGKMRDGGRYDVNWQYEVLLEERQRKIRESMREHQLKEFRNAFSNLPPLPEYMDVRVADNPHLPLDYGRLDLLVNLRLVSLDDVVKDRGIIREYREAIMKFDQEECGLLLGWLRQEKKKRGSMRGLAEEVRDAARGPFGEWYLTELGLVRPKEVAALTQEKKEELANKIRYVRLRDLVRPRSPKEKRRRKLLRARIGEKSPPGENS